MANMDSVSLVDLSSLSINQVTTSATALSVSTGEELSNFYTIAWLLINVGTVELRNKFCQLLGQTPLKNWLEDQFKRNKQSLVTYQWKLLRTTDGNFVEDASSFDISLLSGLMKIYFREKERPLSKDDQQLNDIVDYLSNERNKLYAHVPHLTLNNDKFKETLNKLNEIFLVQMNVPEERLKVPFTVYSTEKLREMEKQIMNEAMKNFDHFDRSVETMLKRLIDVDESLDDFVNYVDGILAEILAMQRSHGELLEDVVRSQNESLTVQKEIRAEQNEIKVGQSEIKASIEERGGVTSKFGGTFHFAAGSHVQFGDNNTQTIYCSSSRHSNSESRRCNSLDSTSRAAAATKSEKPSPRITRLTVPDIEVNSAVMTLVSENLSGGKSYALARKLGLSDPVIDNIKYRFGSDSASELTYQFLREWHESVGKDATVQVLAKALVDVKQAAVAQLLSSHQT